MRKKVEQTTMNQQTKVYQHPFTVGAHFHNRDGDYQVISIDEPNMVIRYLDGRTLESLITVQARIWENMQEDNSSDLEFELL